MKKEEDFEFLDTIDNKVIEAYIYHYDKEMAESVSRKGIETLKKYLRKEKLNTIKNKKL